MALKYADEIVTEIGLESVLEICDEVHTMTSLVGFEALMRNKKVFTYGMPFYAGWGLTQDTREEKRRKRRLNLNELIAGTLILYPSYISPFTLKFCEIETVMSELEEQKRVYNSSVIVRVKIRSRNFISRKLQFFLRILRINT